MRFFFKLIVSSSIKENLFINYLVALNVGPYRKSKINVSVFLINFQSNELVFQETLRVALKFHFHLKFIDFKIF